MPKKSELLKLTSVGPVTLKQLEQASISTLQQLARQDPAKLYKKLCKVTGKKQCVFVQDAFAAAIAQARNPSLPKEKRMWHYWTRLRKARAGKL